MTSTTSDNSRFFIVGSGRSGSTLLRLLLSAHSRLFVPPETWFILPLVEQLPISARLSEKQLQRAIDIMVSDYRWPDLEFAPETLSNLARQLTGPTLRKVVDLVYDLLLRRSGKQRLGDKTPPYISIVPKLAMLYPDAKFIHLIRDGRDVAISFMDLGFRQRCYDGPKFEWTAAMRLAARYRRSPLSKQFFEVKYEDLISDPEATLRAICSFLGEDFECDMLKAERQMTLIPERERHIHPRVTEPISNTQQAGWRHKLSPAECFLMEACLGADLRRLGYPLRFSKVAWRPLLALTGRLLRIIAPVLHRALPALRRRNLISEWGYL